MSDPLGGDQSHMEELATFGQRAFARAIDFLVMAMIGAALLVPSAKRDPVTDDITTPGWAVLVTLLVWLLYETAMVAAIGQTVGKMATMCRVVDRRTGAKPNLIQAAGRSLILVGLVRLFGAYGLLILITAVADQQTRRGALDWITGTVVVRAQPPKRLRATEEDNPGRFN